MEEEEDLDIKQEGGNIKEDDEYIERICLVNWDSPPIYDDYPEDFSQGEKVEPITHIVDETFDIQKQKVINPF